MSYNGTGTFNINTAGQPVVTGTTITSTAFNLLTADLATGLTTALTKDGQTTPTANIPMGSFKITGLGAGSLATDAAQYGQLQAGATTIATVTGTDTLTGSVAPALGAYATGNLFSFVAANTNTGAVTINLNSLGAKSITKQGATALVAGDITSGRVYLIEYDGTQFQLVNSASPGGSNTQVQYNNAGAFAGSANMTFDGTSLTLANGASIQGLTVGRGAGAVSTNTVFGASAYQANTTGSNSVVVGNQAGYTNSTGIQNVFIGTQAGYAATGRDSTFVGTGAGGAITSGTNNTIIGQYDGNGDGLDIRTASNYAVISDGDGNRLLSTANGYSLALDGGAVPQTGTGITFPASQSASTDPQTLDDYEEGTWTPTLSSITNWTGTPTTTYAKYIKIGKSVFMEFQFSGTVTAGSTATYFIITLPITATSTSVSGGANVAEGYNGAVLAQNSTSCYIFFTAATGLTSGAHNPTGTATYSSAS